MSNYRYQIGKYKDRVCLSIMITNGKEVATAQIPIEYIETSIELYKLQVAREEKKDDHTRQH